MILTSLKICRPKKILLFLCIYIKCTHIVSRHGKNDWSIIVNEKHLETALDYKNLASKKTQYYSTTQWF